MQKLQWDETLSVGNELIDDEHKTLIQKINDVSEAISKGIGETQVARTIEFLRDYSIQHFSSEEKIMNEKKYPQIKEHLKMHSEFVTTINDIEKDFREEGTTKELVNTINHLLINWLRKHIKETDKKLALFLAK